ncbi:hypothetical protein ACVWZA_001878 [Sphingomonas sp. UYAg733]
MRCPLGTCRGRSIEGSRRCEVTVGHRGRREKSSGLQAVTKEERQMEMLLHHQNMMLAIRKEMGWPAFKPVNDCLAFSSGKEMDIESGMEIARIAQMLGKDVVYSGWASSKATEPAGLCVAYREMFSVDIVDRLVPYAANDDAPLPLVSARSDEYFVVDRRGTLQRVRGKPKDIGAGRKLAMKRIKATAATLGSEMLGTNRFVKPGASIEPETPTETIVRFG